MKWALVDKDGIVKNVIVYDEKNKYTPPDGLVLLSINEWVNIGSHKDTIEPELIIDNEEQRNTRVKMFMNDLCMVACFELSKKDNPDLKFSDYLDYLEKKCDEMKNLT